MTLQLQPPVPSALLQALLTRHWEIAECQSLGSLHGQEGGTVAWLGGILIQY